MKNIILALATLVVQAAVAQDALPKIESGYYETPTTADVCTYQILQSPDLKTILITIASAPGAAKKHQYCEINGQDVGSGLTYKFHYYFDQTKCGNLPCYVTDRNVALWVFSPIAICMDKTCTVQNLSKLETK